MRVGLTPMFRTVTSEPGSPAAAQRKKAAEEMSPGTSTRVPFGRDGVTDTVSPSTRTGTPMPRSIRSVWSRDRSGSRTLVSPLGAQPGQQDGALHLGAGHLELVAARR